MTVDIYIREKSGKREIRIPLIPEELPFQKGDVTVVSYEIMGLGEVAIPSGTELGTWTWQSAFPGEYRKNDPLIRGSWMAPETYDSILNDWKANGTELNLLVTGYPINADVYVKEYHSKAAGAFGDIVYELTFFEARTIVVTTTKVAQTAATTTRPAATSSTHTVKSDDTLWDIAKMFYGSGAKWGIIYNANKDIIEKTARSRGMKSSDNGHWIFSGTVLTIPDASTAGKATQTTTTTTPSTPTTPTTPKTPPAVAQAYTSNRNAAVDTMVNRINKAKNTGFTVVNAVK